MDLKLHFDDKEHEYTLRNDNDEKVLDLISVTQLMSKHGLSVNYEGIDPDVLERAAQFGIICHKYLEKYFRGDIVIQDVIPVVKEGIHVLEVNEFHSVANEIKVHNSQVAGTIDMVAMKNDKLVLIDFKFTSSFNAYAVTWQLSIYKYLLKHSNGMEVDELYCLWYNKPKERYELKIIKAIDEKFIEELLEDDRQGKIYTESQYNVLKVLEKELAIDREMLKFYQAQEYANKLNANINLLKKELLDEMERYNIRNYETDTFKFTRVLPSKTKSYDYKELIKDLPEDFDIKKYEKIEERKGSLRITKKEGK